MAWDSSYGTDIWLKSHEFKPRLLAFSLIVQIARSKLQ